MPSRKRLRPARVNTIGYRSLCYRNTFADTFSFHSFLGVVAYDNAGSHEVLNEWGHNFDAWPVGRLVPIGAIEQAADAVAELAAYFRSDAHKPLLVSPLPSSLEVLHRWERMIEALL